jgi:hypothetical protein
MAAAQNAGEIGKAAGDEKTCEKHLYLDFEAEGGGRPPSDSNLKEGKLDGS